MIIASVQQVNHGVPYAEILYLPENVEAYPLPAQAFSVAAGESPEEAVAIARKDFAEAVAIGESNLGAYEEGSALAGGRQVVFRLRDTEQDHKVIEEIVAYH